MTRIVNLPEANVIAFAFLLNYPWEFLQAPLFQDLVTAPHWEAVKRCSRAAVGDAVIALFAFWAVAAGSRARSWILRPTHSQLLGFIGVGLAITIVIEQLATGSLGLWTYADTMPTIPEWELPLFFSGSFCHPSWCGSCAASLPEPRSPPP